MKVAVDTSVLVAGSVAGHVDELRAAPWLRAVHEGRFSAITSTHALAETWATLTAIPVEPRVQPATATRVVERLAAQIKPVALRWEDYRWAFERCTEQSARSGAVYDALHFAVAVRQRADVFLTFNTRHFTRFAGSDGPKIMAPPDPPGLGGY